VNIDVIELAFDEASILVAGSNGALDARLASSDRHWERTEADLQKSVSICLKGFHD
jgi:hypothetical protein